MLLNATVGLKCQSMFTIEKLALLSFENTTCTCTDHNIPSYVYVKSLLFKEFRILEQAELLNVITT